MIQVPKITNPYLPAQWNQKNDSDLSGSLWVSFNLDFSENEGKLRLGKRLLANTLTSDVAALAGYPVGFRIQNQTGKAIWTVANTQVFYQAVSYPSGTGTGFLADANTSTPTDCSSALSDIELFNGELYVSRNSSSVSYLPANSSTWSTIASFGNGGSPTPLCVYGNRLYSVGGTGQILSINTSHVVATAGNTFTVAIPDGTTGTQLITFMRAASNRIWIGTLNLNGNKGYIHEWDGSAQTVTKSYRLEAAGALACVIKDDIPYVIDSLGQLIVWNGGTFTKLDMLNRRNKKILFNAAGTDNTRFIHPNGMSVVNGKINMLIDGRNYDNATASANSIEETIPSGIWEYDENRGLIHKGSIAVAHAADTIKDYGQVKISGVGALAEWNVPSTSTTRNGTLLCGASYYQDATTVKSGIFYDDSNDTLQKAGYFITTKQPAVDAKGNSSVQNMWQNIYTVYKKLLDSNDKMVVKYRVYEAEPITATITWASTTTFTTTTDVTAYWTSGTGYEVEVLNGIGAGKCSHITSIVNNSGTYTVTVNETYTGATGTAQARFQFWTYIDTISYNSSLPAGVTFDQAGIGALSNWIQFKIWMLFTGKDEIEKLLIVNQDYNPAN